MKLSTVAAFTGALVSVLPARAGAPEAHGATWEPVEWRGERAFVAVDGAWRAVVSADRGRLIYFGPAGENRNVLFAPATRHDPAGWGGHRLWLGPQDAWPGGWPPPAAWEKSAVASAECRGAVLTLVLPPSGDGWPDVTREYFWEDGALHCRGRFRGGRRPAQFIHILQVKPEAVVIVKAAPSAAALRGYVQLHLGRKPSPQPVFAVPPQVTELGDGRLQLDFRNRTEKLGFAPQSLLARLGGIELTMARGTASGRELTTPDDGFVTQVYLGSGENQLIELEQLSPLYAPGADASCEIVVAARAAH